MPGVRALLFAFIIPLCFSTFLGENYPIRIEPSKDHTIKFGTPLELFCLLNKSDERAANRTSYHMTFSSDQPYNGTQSIVNGTAIRLYAPHLELREYMFYCILNADYQWRRPISIAVGKEPEKASNFNCVSENWSNLTCSWIPGNNSVKTEYNLVLTLKGRAGRIPRPCPNGTDVKYNKCIYTKEFHYHQPHEVFYFNLTGKNEFGVISQNFTIEHYKVVLPAPPENLRKVNTTESSCLIAWDLPHPMQHFPPGVGVLIEVKSEWDETDAWQDVNTTGINIRSDNYTYNIVGLKYPGSIYDVRVYLQSPGSKFKSSPATLTFTTAPTIPSEPPKTTPGCFEVKFINETHYTLVIYWQIIHVSLKNGGNFGYKVVSLCENEYGGYDQLQEISEMNHPYATFNVSRIHKYRFQIYSFNEFGRSKRFSEVLVPPYESVARPNRPAKSTYGEGQYGLTWDKSASREVTSYTAFYCEDDIELPPPCKGVMNWVTVSGNMTARNITVKNKDKFHQFGVAANQYNGFSSGIYWATCLVNYNPADLQVAEFTAIRPTSATADMVWQLGCVDSSALLGYELYYCSVSYSENNSNTKCLDVENGMKVMDPHARNATIKNLTPYTTYSVTISILFKNGVVGRRTKEVRLTTLEDAPDPPSNLRAANVTNSSFIVLWDLPVNKNGAIQKFLLHLSPGREPLTIDVPDNKNIETSYTVNHLTSSTTYKLYLQACNLGDRCSNKSQILNVTTKMYKPAKIAHLQTTFINEKSANITWETPSYLSNSFFYQIRFLSSDRSVIGIYNASDRHLVINIDHLCDSLDGKAVMSARAINVDLDDNKYFNGLWSADYHAPCRVKGRMDLYVIILTVVGVLVIIGSCLPLIAKRMYNKCKKMKNVVVKLPSGLEPPQDLEKNHLEAWPPHRNGGDVQQAPCSDEETLLTQTKDNCASGKGQVYGDSSCSESSESGVLEENHGDPHVMPWEDSRLRRAPGLRDEIDGEFSVRPNVEPAPEILPEDEERYIRLGRSSTPNEVADGYVTIANVPTQSPDSSVHVNAHPVASPRPTRSVTMGNSDVYVKLPPPPTVSTTSSPSSSKQTTYVTLADLKDCNPPLPNDSPVHYTESSFSCAPGPSSLSTSSECENDRDEVAIVENNDNEDEENDFMVDDSDTKIHPSTSESMGGMLLNRPCVSNNYVPHKVFGEKLVQT